MGKAWEPVTRREVVLLLAVVLLALGLRAWRLPEAALNHFDAGIYAFTARHWADPSAPYLIPGQARLAPPLYPATVSLVHRVGVPVDRAAIWVNVALGTLGVGLTWWVARRWWGGPAGIAAAALLALSQAHVAFSRAGLTDALFVLLFLLGVALIVEAVERPGAARALGAGLVVGLAWNTKYHGALALVPTGAALAPAWRTLGGKATRALGMWAVAGVMTAVLAIPWLVYLRLAEDYAQLAMDHVSLFGTNWMPHAVRQVEQQMFLDGPVGRAAPLAAFASALALGGRIPWRRIVLVTMVSAVVSLVGGYFWMVAGLALLGAGRVLWQDRSYASWVAVAWLGLWIVVGPAYHPYARLMLPFTVVACLLGGACLGVLAGGEARPAGSLAGPAVALVAAGVVILASLRLPAGGDPWRPAADLPAAAARVAARVPVGEPVLVVAEPPLALYVEATGRPVRAALSDLGRTDGAGYLLVGAYARRMPGIARALARHAGRLTPIESLRFRPSDVRLLDDLEPARARGYLASPDGTFDLTLYRVVRDLSGASVPQASARWQDLGRPADVLLSGAPLPALLATTAGQ